MFKKTRFQLTAWYLLIIMLVSFSFSFFIYKGLASEVDRFAQMQRFRIENRIKHDVFIPNSNNPKPPPFILLSDPDLVKETKERILFILFIINSIIFVMSGILGYLLAGLTLSPIKKMIDEQNRFISDASHEFRTPLTSLKIAMEVFLRDKKSNITDAKKLVLNSISEVDRLSLLSDDLLHLSQYQNNSKKNVLKKNSLNEIINIAIEKIMPLIYQKKIKVNSQKTSKEVLVDKNELINLIIIILDNAIKYSKENSSIEIKYKNDEDYFDLHIIDHGIGIAKKDLPNIFNRFYRADSARVKGGYGLGLPIASKIAKRNNVLLSINSVLGKGTDFVIRFLQ